MLSSLLRVSANRLAAQHDLREAVCTPRRAVSVLLRSVSNHEKNLSTTRETRERELIGIQLPHARPNSNDAHVAVRSVPESPCEQLSSLLWLRRTEGHHPPCLAVSAQLYAYLAPDLAQRRSHIGYLGPPVAIHPAAEPSLAHPDLHCQHLAICEERRDQSEHVVLAARVGSILFHVRRSLLRCRGRLHDDLPYHGSTVAVTQTGGLLAAQEHRASHTHDGTVEPSFCLLCPGAV